MSFTIDSLREGSKNHPIAIIQGLPRGSTKKYVYLDSYKPSLEDYTAHPKLDLPEDKLEDLKTAIKTGYEPNDDKLVSLYYKILATLKESKQRLVIRQGKLFPLPNPSKAERVYVCGISGSGKSHFSAEYIKQYLKINKGNDFLLTSQIDCDDVLDKLEPNRITPEEVMEEGVDLDDIKDSIWCWDDIFSYPTKTGRTELIQILDNLCETSRHTNTSLVITSHLISNGVVSRRVLNETTKLVMFIKSNAKNIYYYLENYEKWDKDSIKRLLNLNSRWVMLDKQNGIPIVLYERGAYIV